MNQAQLGQRKDFLMLCFLAQSCSLMAFLILTRTSLGEYHFASATRGTSSEKGLQNTFCQSTFLAAFMAALSSSREPQTGSTAYGSFNALVLVQLLTNFGPIVL
jgi:hypothetical protein